MLPHAIEHPSPNHGPRRDGARPDIVLLHGTAMATLEAARDRLCDPAAEVSCHWLIGRDGAVLRLVPETERAWHAGVSAWGAVEDVNSRSIGIELDCPGPFRGPAAPEYPAAQMAALLALLDGIRARWGIPPERVLAHSDVAPGRKDDPGERFDWEALARAGHAAPRPAAEAAAMTAAMRAAPAAFPSAAPAAGERRAAALAALERLGYRAAPDAALEAARLRFAPLAAPIAPGAAPDPELTALLIAAAQAAPCRG